MEFTPSPYCAYSRHYKTAPQRLILPNINVKRAPGRLNFAVIQLNDELCVEKVMKMLQCNAASNRMELADGSQTLVLVLSH